MSTGFDGRHADDLDHYADLARGFVPFAPERATAYRQAGFWTGDPLDSILRDAAATWPDRTAVVDTEHRYTFAELDALADRVAGRIAALGVLPGDRMLLQLPNTCQFAVALFGLLRAGVVPVLCLPGHRGAEMGHFAAVSGAVGLVLPEPTAAYDSRAMAAQLVAEHEALRHIIIGGPATGAEVSWSALTGPDGTDTPPRLRVNTALPAVLLVSGGTTGDQEHGRLRVRSAGGGQCRP